MENIYDFEHGGYRYRLAETDSDVNFFVFVPDSGFTLATELEQPIAPEDLEALIRECFRLARHLDALTESVHNVYHQPEVVAALEALSERLGCGPFHDPTTSPSTTSESST